MPEPADQLRCLITAGPTREYIDPVRFFSNDATGTLGAALARVALERGWRPCVVAGPGSAPTPEGVERVEVVSAQDMYEAVVAAWEATHVLIASAAVADYRPRERFPDKLKKGEGPLHVEFERTPDILAWCGANRRRGQTLVGFGLESDPDLRLPRYKLSRKRCDLLVHNSPANFGEGGGVVRIVDDRGVLVEGELSKPALAEALIDAVARLRSGQPLSLLRPWDA